MMWRALSADWLKIRGKGIWFLVFLGPIGLVAMQGLNFGLRYDYLRQQYSADLWGGLLDNVSGLCPQLFSGRHFSMLVDCKCRTSDEFMEAALGTAYLSYLSVYG